MDADARTRRAVVMTLLPAWIVPGFLDYLCHRRTRIERTSGTLESLTHAGMMAVAGVPVGLGLVCEIEPLVLAVGFGAAVLHTAIAWIDIGYTAPRRPIVPFEQHVHAGLEMLPFVTLAALANAYPGPLRELFAARESDARAWRLTWKREPLPTWYVASVLAASVGFVALPYAEELWRCATVARPDADR